jgi:PilZ domain
MANDRITRMRRERRKTFRVEWNFPATIHDLERNLARTCILSNFSNGGAEITGVLARTVPDEFMLQITQADVRKSRVVWRTDNALGVKFTDRATSTDAPKHGPRTQEPVEDKAHQRGGEGETTLILEDTRPAG